MIKRITWIVSTISSFTTIMFDDGCSCSGGYDEKNRLVGQNSIISHLPFLSSIPIFGPQAELCELFYLLSIMFIPIIIFIVFIFKLLSSTPISSPKAKSSKQIRQLNNVCSFSFYLVSSLSFFQELKHLDDWEHLLTDPVAPAVRQS